MRVSDSLRVLGGSRGGPLGWSRANLGRILLAIAALTSPAFGDPAFVDVTSSANLNFTNPYGDTFASNATMQRNMGNGAAVGDYDGDGDLDIYLLSNLGFDNVLYRNDLDLGVKSFTDVTSFAGVAAGGLSRVAHFADLDNDGDLDLLVINDNNKADPSRVFRNDGDGTFSDVTTGSNFEPGGYLRAGCALADYDNDGLLDVYVTVWTLSNFPGWNVLYRNLGGLQFQDVTSSSGLDFLNRDSFTAIFADFNEDHHPDLYVAVDHTSDEFYVNEEGTFSLVTGSVGTTHLGNDMGVGCADYDDDGDLDMFVTNITDPSGVFGTTQFNALYENQLADTGSLTFNDRASFRGVEDVYWGWGADFIDVENDGDLDIVAVNGMDEYIASVDVSHPLLDTPTVLFVNDGAGFYTRNLAPGLEPGYDSRALIAFDYDRDGDRDLLITNTNQNVVLLENVSSPMGSWLDVQVIQRPGSNRDGVGVTVYATIDGVTKRRDILMGVSYLAGTPAEVHFGLGESAAVDTLRVEWTDGSETIQQDVAANQLLVIEQPLSGGPSIPTLSTMGVLVMAVPLLLIGAALIKRRELGDAHESLID